MVGGAVVGGAVVGGAVVGGTVVLGTVVFGTVVCSGAVVVVGVAEVAAGATIELCCPPDDGTPVTEGSPHATRATSATTTKTRFNASPLPAPDSTIALAENPNKRHWSPPAVLAASTNA